MKSGLLFLVFSSVLVGCAPQAPKINMGMYVPGNVYRVRCQNIGVNPDSPRGHICMKYQREAVAAFLDCAGAVPTELIQQCIKRKAPVAQAWIWNAAHPERPI